MATIVIKVDGVDITDDVVFSRTRFTSLADGNVGNCQLTIDDQAQTYPTGHFDAGQTIELLVDGERAWDGWIFTVGRSWPLSFDDTSIPTSVPRFWTIMGQDRNLLFHKRITFRQDDPSDNAGFKIWPEDTSDKTALEYALANYVDLSSDGLTYHIENIGSPGPFEEFTLGHVSAPLGSLFEDASKMTGGVYFISPGRVLSYVSDTTPSAPFALSDAPSGSDVGYREFEAALDYSQGANEALVWGAGKGSDDPVFAKYTDDAAVAAYDLWQWGDLSVGAWKQTTVNRRAQTYVEGSPSHRRGHGDPVPVVRCSIFDPGLTAGMVVDFSADVFGYQENLPVRSSTISFPTDNAVRYDLELTLKIDLPFSAYDQYPFAWPAPYVFGDPILPWPPPPPVDVTADHYLIDHFDIDDGSRPVTAAQDVTNAPWEGGNPYFLFNNDVSILADWTIADSNLYSVESNPNAIRAFDTEVNAVTYYGDTFKEHYSYMDGPYPWAAWSTSWWSDGATDSGVDLLIKWRFTGAATMSNEGLVIKLRQFVLGDTEGDSWYCSTGFGIKNQSMYIFHALEYDYGGAWPSYDEDQPYFMNPAHAYLPGYSGFVSDTWYWTRIKLGSFTGGYGFPYISGSGTDLNGTGYELSEMKTWEVGTDEPSVSIRGYQTWYWDYSAWPPENPPPVPVDEMNAAPNPGWDLTLPQPWRQNVNPSDSSEFAFASARNMLEVGTVYETSTTGRFEVDGIWAYNPDAGGGSSGTPTDVPVYDGDASTSEAQFFVTPYPYMAGSLVVYLDGIRLRAGVDYVETNPSAGQFMLLMDHQDGTSIGSITTSYIRASTDPTTTGGSVYRPVGQLAYGWGTPLDGYNSLMAASAMALDRHTEGTYTMFVGTPRNTTPNHRANQANQSSVGDITDAATACAAGWGEGLELVANHTFAAFSDLIDDGRGAILMGTYGSMPADKRFSTSYSGTHALFINERFSDGTFLGYDPLYPYPVIYTASQLQAFAVGYPASGLVRAAFTQVT